MPLQADLNNKNHCHIAQCPSLSADAAGTGASPAMPRTLPIGQAIEVMLKAVAQRRAWVNDFYYEPIHISADFFEVLQAAQGFNAKA